MAFVGAVALPLANTPAGLRREGRYPRLSGFMKDLKCL